MQLRHRNRHLGFWLVLAPLIAVLLLLSVTRRQELPPEPANPTQSQP